MKRSLPAIIVAVVIIVVIACMMCAFQMPFTETVVVTRFDRPVADQPKEPGLYFKLPWPIERVHRFDTRLRTFETEFRQGSTKDQQPVIMTAYATWRVADGLKFLESFPTLDDAEREIRSLLSNQVSLALKHFDLDELVNTRPDEMKLGVFETEVLDGVAEGTVAEADQKLVGMKTATAPLGIEVVSIGVKRLGLSESVTKNVFERMKAERDNVSKKLEAEGISEAQRIRDEAREMSEKILARARAYADKLLGQGEAEAAKTYAVFEQNRELADFLKKLESFEEILKAGKTALVLDAKTFPAFEILSDLVPSKAGAPAPENVSANASPEKTGEAKASDDESDTSGPLVSRD